MALQGFPISEQNKPNAVFGKRQKKLLEWLIILFLSLFYSIAVLAQENGLEELNYVAPSTFSPTIRDAVKFSDLPEIKDSVIRIKNIKYGISSRPYFPKYEVQKIEAAKIQNEPLNKLYRSLLKVGYGPIYNQPYAEFWINNLRSKENNVGFHAKHYSGTPHLSGVGDGSFSDNEANLYGKKFYKKHSLFGELNYRRNVVHYYGYDTSYYNTEKSEFSKQRYQLIEPRVRLLSHYSDSTHINHDIRLSYYNLDNLQKETENNIKAEAYTSFFVNKEKLNLNLITDLYNHKQRLDTLNDLIVTLNPSFEASGKKWFSRVGLSATLDNFKNQSRFYFYPEIYLHYNIYEDLITPYGGVNGALIKNSFRSISTINPFVDSTLNYNNTNNKYNLFLGLRGNLSSKTSYDVKLTYSQFDNLALYAINFADKNKLYNRFEMLYDNTSLLNFSGQLKHQMKEKINLIAKGNYYLYETKNLDYAYHRPDFDITFSGIYNLNSKIIVKADLFFVGNQWARTATLDSLGRPTYSNKQLKGYFDANLGVEYRYSKMLSFFGRFNNIANQRYYRWDQYPSMRFHFMLGLTFVPF